MPKTKEAVDAHIGQALRAARLAKGMSQGALGSALGMTFQQVQKYESGTNRISAGKLHRAAELLGVRPGDLFPQSNAPPAVPLSSKATILAQRFDRLTLRGRSAVEALVDTLDEGAKA